MKALNKWLERRKNVLTEDYEVLLKALTALDSDLDAEGWDLPNYIYEVQGMQDDPAFRKVATVENDNPILALVYAWSNGLRVTRGTEALLYSLEGKDHLTLTEALTRRPQLREAYIEAMIERAAQVTVEGRLVPKQMLGEMTDEQIMPMMTEYYNKFVVSELPNPCCLSEEMRCDIRTLAAVTRDGMAILHHKRRASGQIEIQVLGPEEVEPSTHATAAYLFLHDLNPDPMHSDPLGAVRDYEIIQQIDSLPTEAEERP